jgi:putative component of membrane protein insertase Oxa1/YidC/SpoIIIJ protein YidD
MLLLADKIFKKGACALIRAYQYTLSPDHGLAGVFVAGQCKYQPTCSQFAYEQIQKKGITAFPSIIYRIFNCR